MRIEPKSSTGLLYYEDDYLRPPKVPPPLIYIIRNPINPNLCDFCEGDCFKKVYCDVCKIDHILCQSCMNNKDNLFYNDDTLKCYKTKETCFDCGQMHHEKENDTFTYDCIEHSVWCVKSNNCPSHYNVCSQCVIEVKRQLFGQIFERYNKEGDIRISNYRDYIFYDSNWIALNDINYFKNLLKDDHYDLLDEHHATAKKIIEDRERLSKQQTHAKKPSREVNYVRRSRHDAPNSNNAPTNKKATTNKKASTNKNAPTNKKAPTNKEAPTNEKAPTNKKGKRNGIQGTGQNKNKKQKKEDELKKQKEKNELKKQKKKDELNKQKEKKRKKVTVFPKLPTRLNRITNNNYKDKFMKYNSNHQVRYLSLNHYSRTP